MATATITARPAHFKTRDQWDEDTWNCIAIHNEYELPDRLEPADVVIDIGAHIGCFSTVVLERGAGVVLAYECEPKNAALLRENLAPYPAAKVYELAVWRSDQSTAKLFLQSSSNPANSGGGSVTGSQGIPVEPIAFDDVLREALALTVRIRLVKLDCEGSEFPILFTSRLLNSVEEIVGEYHLRETWEPYFRGTRFTVDGLTQLLERQGFVVSSRPTSEWLGFFRAQRNPG
jgi:FkbM family methyltransferase